MEGFRDESGLFAVAGHHGAAEMVWRGLRALAHRGREGASIAVSDGAMMRTLRVTGPALGLGAESVQDLTGSMGLGAVYGAGWGTLPPQVPDQAYLGRFGGGQLSVGVAGRFTNGTWLRQDLMSKGALFGGSADAELLAQLIARSGQRTIVNRVVDALFRVDGAFSVVVMTEDRVVAVRDPRGFRPLFLGSVGEAKVIATEDAAIRRIGGVVSREVRSGEMVIIDAAGLQTVSPFPAKDRSVCSMELVSLAGADATVAGRPVQGTRWTLGEALAQERPAPKAQVVVGWPGAGLAETQAFAAHHGLLLVDGLVADPRSPGEGPGPADHVRVLGGVVEGKRVALVVRSLARGRSLSGVVRALKVAGASGVDVRIASPAIRTPCPYGVGSPLQDELLASTLPSLDDAARIVGADTFAWLSLAAFQAVLGQDEGWCLGCCGGELPVPVEEGDGQLPLFEG